MKIIAGEKFFTKREVAEMVGRSPQTIHLWHKWSEELEGRGCSEDRLIPAPLRMKNGYRMWSEDAVVKIKRFAESIEYGDLAEFSRRQWGRGVEKK